MDNKYIFIKLMEDLKIKSKSLEGYDLIKACGLLRQLLLDELPLIHSINREFNIKIQFELGRDLYEYNPLNDKDNPKYIGPPPVIKMVVIGTSDPRLNLGNLKEFLKKPLIKHFDHDYTIMEIIKIASHVMGGIHSGKPENEKQEVFANLDKSMKPLFLIGSINMTLVAMKGISEVCVAALHELEQKVIESMKK